MLQINFMSTSCEIALRWMPQNTLDDISQHHHRDVIMSAMASQITGVSTVYSTISTGADQRKHQSSKSLAFVRGIHRWLVNSPHKGLLRRKMFPFDDIILIDSGNDGFVPSGKKPFSEAVLTKISNMSMPYGITKPRQVNQINDG